MNITTQFTLNGIGVTSLAATITIVKISDGTIIINEANMTEISAANCAGWYTYEFSGYDESNCYIFTSNANTDNVDDRFPNSTNNEDIIELDIHNYLDSYTNKNDYKADGFATPSNVTDARDNINSNVDAIPTNPLLTNDNRLDNLDAKISEIEGMSEADLHIGLDNYANKNDYKADISGLLTSADSRLNNLDAAVSSRSIFDNTLDEVTTTIASQNASKATTTIASNMRGTDNANTIAPDNSNIAIILADTNEINTKVDIIDNIVDSNKVLIDLNLDAKISEIESTGMSEADLHIGLDNYANKNDYKADISGLPTLIWEYTR